VLIRHTRLQEVSLTLGHWELSLRSNLDVGQPVEDPSSALQIRAGQGNGGLSVLADTQLIETLAHFARERIPERYGHQIVLP
jgi:catalase